MEGEDPGCGADVSMGGQSRLLRAAAVKRLQQRRAAGELSTAHVRLVASSLDVSVRTVWRWLARAEATGSASPVPRTRLEVTGEVVDVLADVCGNVKRAHEELARRARAAGEEPPGLTTLHDAIRRDLTPGFMAGLREGIPAARGHDPAFKRPAVRRNEVWEGDHKQAPTRVGMPDGSLAKVWVTWFEDRATQMVMGWAVTAASAHRGSVLAALRSSVLREDLYGPAGGLPDLVRIDGGADFVSKTVRAAFGALDVPVHVVTAARLKGGVERLNRTAVTRFFADLPRSTKAPLLDHKTRVGQDDPALTFEAFVGLLRDWVAWHNTEYVVARTGVTPLQAWEADARPLREVDAEDLRAYMLESDGKPRRITSRGVDFHGRSYMPMDGVGRIGMQVYVRWMPHHAHEVALYTVRQGRYLGRAVLSDQASEAERRKVLAARDERDRVLRRALQRSAVRRRTKYEASTQAAPPKPATAMTRREAVAELEEIQPRSRLRRATGAAY
ncbi:Mu transposase C-terminal domain-containing protein [Streptomyces seoulensis]|nr:Mu transposase C-terminal domain-containing protein [Streptomyces seoulensis]QKW30769.1 Mu transposase C-terminal domain-containing protein [Streptomyces seoulensis]